jgi:hypothetical protein
MARGKSSRSIAAAQIVTAECSTVRIPLRVRSSIADATVGLDPRLTSIKILHPLRPQIIRNTSGFVVGRGNPLLSRPAQLGGLSVR